MDENLDTANKVEGKSKDAEGRSGISHPFYHRIVEDFLPSALFDAVCCRYNSTKFYEKHTDLFHFYQSDELRDDGGYKAFIDCVKKEILKDALATKEESFEAISKDCVVDLFASYYGKGDYLLPHDDCLEGRVFAFSFYLNDPSAGEGHSSGPNGQLVLYNADGITPSARIAPKPNRLVIFEVSSKSYHEVEVAQAPRTALTGWLRSPGFNPQSEEVPYSLLRYDVFSEEDVLTLDEWPEGTVSISLLDSAYMAQIVSKLLSLSYVPRLNKLFSHAMEPEDTDSNRQTLKSIAMPSLNGRVRDTLVLRLCPEGYILLNDPFNTCSDALVILSLGERDITLVDSAGTVVSSISSPGLYLHSSPSSMFIPPASPGSASPSFLVAYRIDRQ